MRVLVLGGSGFIGSHVVDVLVERGFRVRVLSRRPEFFRSPVPSVEYVNGDFSNATLLPELLMGMDAVVHLVSTTVPATSNMDPVADINGNLISTVNLLKAMRTVGLRNLVYLSSGGTVYGVPISDPIAENHPLQPVTSYGIVKTAIEKYLYMSRYADGLRYCALRASNPYGPRQGHGGVQGVVGTYLWRVVNGHPVEVWGDGSIVRDFVYVRDIAELCVAALCSDISGVFNAGYGVGFSVLEVISLIEKVAGKKVKLEFKPGRSFDIPKVVLDISRTRAHFEWAPKVDLEEGIQKTWNWVLDQVEYELSRGGSNLAT